RPDLAIGVDEELAAHELAAEAGRLRAAAVDHGLLGAERVATRPLGRDEVGIDAFAGVGEDVAAAAVRRDVLHHPALAAVQPMHAENEVLDDLLLVADLESIGVLAFEARGDGALQQAGGAIGEVRAPLRGLTFVEAAEAVALAIEAIRGAKRT